MVCISVNIRKELLRWMIWRVRIVLAVCVIREFE